MKFVFFKFRLGHQLHGLFRGPDDAIQSRLTVSDESECGIFIDKPFLAASWGCGSAGHQRTYRIRRGLGAKQAFETSLRKGGRMSHMRAGE